MVMRVGRVPYLDCEPFYIDMEHRDIELYDLVPSALAAAAARGEIDAGPIPLVDCYRLADRFQPVAGFCLACTERARSMFLYSQRPIAELDGARIGIPDEASTSAKLLQMLLRLKYQVEPAAYVPLNLQAPDDAMVLIGNQGLRHRRGARGFPHTYDLGEEWHRWTGLPLVYARWMVRKDLDPQDIALLEYTLYVGLEEGVDALFHLSAPRDDLLMMPRDIVEYVQGLRYYIRMSEQRAIDRFRQYLGELDT